MNGLLVRGGASVRSPAAGAALDRPGVAPGPGIGREADERPSRKRVALARLTRSPSAGSRRGPGLDAPTRQNAPGDPHSNIAVRRRARSRPRHLHARRGRAERVGRADGSLVVKRGRPARLPELDAAGQRLVRLDVPGRLAPGGPAPSARHRA